MCRFDSCRSNTKYNPLTLYPKLMPAPVSFKAPEFESQKPKALNSFLIPIAEIWIGARLRKHHPDIGAMAESLLENGQIHAITVRPVAEEDIADGAKPGQWALVTGGRRLAGAITAGWKEIRAENLEHMSMFKRRAIELEENLQRAEMTWDEQVKAKEQLSELYRAENPRWADFQTAQVLGESAASVSRDLKLARAMSEDPELAKASSKKAAMRLMETKTKMRNKLAAMESVDMVSLEQRLANLDAVTFLKSLPDSSVDLFLSDLPYGIDYFDMPSSDRKAGGGTSKFDDSFATALALVNELMPLFLKKAKPSGWIVLMASRELEVAIKNGVVIAKTQKHLDKPKNPNFYTVPWIWYRPNSRSSPIHPQLHAKSMYENIYVINMGQAILHKACENVIMVDSVYEERLHAHQKPVPLGVELISRCTAPGELVIDVTMGSGAFLAAAARTNRLFAGCDTNPEMVQTAQMFVAQHTVGTLAPLQIKAATSPQGAPMTTAGATEIFGSKADEIEETTADPFEDIDDLDDADDSDSEDDDDFDADEDDEEEDLD